MIPLISNAFFIITSIIKTPPNRIKIAVGTPTTSITSIYQPQTAKPMQSNLFWQHVNIKFLLSDKSVFAFNQNHFSLAEKFWAKCWKSFCLHVMHKFMIPGGVVSCLRFKSIFWWKFNKIWWGIRAFVFWQSADDTTITSEYGNLLKCH